VLSGVTASALLMAMGRFRLPSRPDLAAMFAVGGLQLGLYFALAHEAVVWVPAGRTAILANTTTVWVVPLSLVFLRERIPPARWVAAGLGLCGVLVLINPLAIDWRSGQVLIGHLFLLGAALAWSVAIIVTRAARPRLTMFALLPWCFLVGAAVLAPVVWWHAPSGTFGDSPVSWWALAYIGLVAGPLGTWCIMEATAKLPVMVSSVGFLTTPAVSLILANVLLHEAFTPDLLAGSVLIMGGVAFAAWPPRRAG
jgi:drug/metabolite transporter (DMT)-like permease